MSSSRYAIYVLIIAASFAGNTIALYAQDRCGTVEYTQKLIEGGGESKLQFEQWIHRNLTTVRAKGTNGTARTKENGYQIPVVVHIIHSGTNHPSNISDEQVLSQLRVLNEDYNRLNEDAANTPDVFASVAGNPQIEFILAKRTPEGLPTTGIVRVLGPKEEWTVADNYAMKSLSYWPAEDYLNIWVCNLTDYLGYAQFPQSDLLSGLQNSSSNRLTDGVVITHSAFGSIDDGNFNLQNNYNRGRTTTHEIGHFFGLRHIWGDDQGACGGDGDYVDDTPDQADRTLNCPSHPRRTCNIVSMFQNFLDYTNDACMNLFTAGQVERMSVILENSPRRNSLLTSPGLLEPQPVANDLGIRSINAPAIGECPGDITPVIEIRNYGNNAVNSATITIKRDNTVLETKNFTLNLDVLESTDVAFASISVQPGSNAFTFEILTTNGVADGNPQDNILERVVFIPGTIDTPVLETFETFPSAWQLFNPDGLYTWELVNAINGQDDNKALKLNFYDYEDNEGEIDVLLSPVIDLSAAPAALLLFDVSYAQYQNSVDGLKVILLSNCNSDVTQGEIIYEKSGSELATAAKMTESYAPQSANDWRTEILNLEAYLGQSNIQLAFVGVNDWGNNLYLDNIRFLTDDFNNVTLKSIISPSPMVCVNAVNPIVVVKNSGTALTSFDVSYTVNGISNIHAVTGLNFPTGAEMEVELPQITLTAGLNDLAISLLNPEGSDDVDPSDNSASLSVVSEKKETDIPFRQDFEGNFENQWTILSPKGNATWTIENFPDNKALVYEAFNNSVTGNEAWLVSPVFNLTGTPEASVLFDLSYATRNNTSEVFQVRASRGCDAPFEVLRSYSGNQLTENNSDVPWKPATEEDWNRKNFLNLNTLTGEPEVRLAFVISNRNGNNFYLDNFQLYLSDDETPVEVQGAFNVYPNPLPSGTDLFISFDLPELENIDVEITDSMGKRIFNASYVSILNQTLSIDTRNFSTGLYLIRVITRNDVFHSKFLIDR